MRSSLVGAEVTQAESSERSNNMVRPTLQHLDAYPIRIDPRVLRESADKPADRGAAKRAFSRAMKLCDALLS